MSKFNLVVNIGLERVADLQSKGLNLCIAKSFEHSATGTKMTVVWYAKEPLTQNTFEWENDTKLFITLHDHRDIPSEANTRYQPIQYDECQTLRIKANGELGIAEGDPNPHSRELVLRNEGLDWTDVVVTSSLTIDSTNHPNLPFYVGRLFKNNLLVMIMLDEVKVWFQDKDEINPGRLVPPIPDDALSVQFVSEGSLNRIATYDKDGKWSLGS